MAPRWSSTHSDPLRPAGHLPPTPAPFLHPQPTREAGQRRALEAMEAPEAGQGGGRGVAQRWRSPYGDPFRPAGRLPPPPAPFLHPQLPREAGRAAVASGLGGARVGAGGRRGEAGGWLVLQ